MLGTPPTPECKLCGSRNRGLGPPHRRPPGLKKNRNRGAAAGSLFRRFLGRRCHPCNRGSAALRSVGGGAPRAPPSVLALPLAVDRGPIAKRPIPAPPRLVCCSFAIAAARGGPRPYRPSHVREVPPAAVASVAGRAR